MQNLRNIIIFIQILFVLPTYSQTGDGLVSVEFDEKTRIEFYSNTLSNSPDKHIQFFDDTTINSYNIKDISTAKEWLQPENMHLDYSSLLFRCTKQTENYYQVIVNNNTGLTYWIKKTNNLKFQDWESFLKNVISISRINKQEIKEKPDSNSTTINYDADDCFHVLKMKGDWINITTIGFCSDEFLLSTENLESGWIRWKNGDNILIEYFLIM